MGLTMITKESIGAMQEPQVEGQPKFLAYSIQDAARAVLELRRRIGKARMNAICKVQEFIRCVYGTTGTLNQIFIAYVCQECGRAPKYDYDYIDELIYGTKIVVEVATVSESVSKPY